MMMTKGTPPSETLKILDDEFMHFSPRCNYEQAIVLASYSLQAESGDHDPEKHTLENLQDLLLLPKTMMTQLSEERFGKTFLKVIIKLRHAYSIPREKRRLLKSTVKSLLRPTGTNFSRTQLLRAQFKGGH